MSEADNRDASNLLLLCLFHAWEVDEFPGQYPAEVLCDWKRAQLDQYERAHQGWQITDVEAREAITVVDLRVAIERVADMVPFNPRMRSRIEAWQLAVRRGHARRAARLKPLVSPKRRAAVVAWMAALDDPVVQVPAGEIRILVARLGAGKSEQAARWWEQGLQIAARDDNTDIPLYFTPRQIVSTLEQAVVTELGGDPTRQCRVVLDDLDEVPQQRAARLLSEARELVQVWPMVSVLATTRPGIAIPDDEKLTIDPWPIERGADLAEVALGDRIQQRLWTSETEDLLTSPLTALALAFRVNAGRDTRVSRARLLADLAPMVIQSHHLDVPEQTWHDLSRLAVALLERPESATPAEFFPLPRLRQLLATDLVAAEDSRLVFALPVFEQYFGAEAVKAGLVGLDAVVSAGSFPRWRYALALAMSAASAHDQETMLIRLARINPAAAFWVLGEIADTNAHELRAGSAEESIAELIRRRDPDGLHTEPDLAIRAGRWLREAEQALLAGLGLLAESLIRHRDGNPTQWGVWLDDGHLTVARARDTVPPPDVVKLVEPHPSLADGWDEWSQFRFPTTEFGRWLRAQSTLQRQLRTMIANRTLPIPRISWLARERLHHLAEFVYDYGGARRRRPIQLDELRDAVATWMDTVNESVHATWQSGSRTVDSDDIRWLSTQLTMVDGDELDRPWPSSDQPRNGKWVWQAYSPDLTLTLATGFVREALTGYRQLVDTNFPAFGSALGLYSLMPARVDGLVIRPTDQDDLSAIGISLVVHPDLTHQDLDRPAVKLQLVTNSHDHQAFSELRQTHRCAAQTTFGRVALEQFQLPLHVASPATNLAYRWLARDLAAIGWLDDRHLFFD